MPKSDPIPSLQGDLTLKPLPKAKPSSTKRKKNVKTPSSKKPKVTCFVPQAHPKAKVTSSNPKVSVQEVTCNEETESNTKMEDSNRVYTENPQDKEDLTEATSKEQEGESTSIASDPLLSLVSPNLRVTCSLLLSKYPKTMRDTSKWTLALRGFLLQQFESIISQLQ
nr:hypothetical protein CFP56_74897 [Quercus suber]POE98407.1 hypothetical protein CFP56_53154 [Quercus suber]